MPYLLLGMGFVFFGVAVFLLSSGLSLTFDMSAVNLLNQYRVAPINQFVIILSYLGGMPFVLLLMTISCIWQIWHKNYIITAFILTGVLGSIAIGWILKWSFDRPRPPEMFQLLQSYGSSFPSVHSVYAATLASLVILISQYHPKSVYILAIALFWAVIMGISRVYAGVHYPTDVLAGWGVGFSWISLLWLIFMQSTLDKNKLFFR